MPESAAKFSESFLSTVCEPTTLPRQSASHDSQIVTIYGGTKIDCSETVSEYISGMDWRVKANANAGYSNAGMINNIAGKVIANFWLDEVYSAEEALAHRQGDLHIHDLDKVG